MGVAQITSPWFKKWISVQRVSSPITFSQALVGDALFGYCEVARRREYVNDHFEMCGTIKKAEGLHLRALFGVSNLRRSDVCAVGHTHRSETTTSSPPLSLSLPPVPTPPPRLCRTVGQQVSMIVVKSVVKKLVVWVVWHFMCLDKLSLETLFVETIGVSNRRCEWCRHESLSRLCQPGCGL